MMPIACVAVRTAKSFLSTLHPFSYWLISRIADERLNTKIPEDEGPFSNPMSVRPQWRSGRFMVSVRGSSDCLVNLSNQGGT